jgi:serine/threonine protein kinase
VHVVAEIASALAYMNEALDENGRAMQIVHRDVSPTNIIIGSSGQVKLIDFGIARQGAAVKEESGVRPGKASYMSPEQAQGAPLDGRSDLFSLGTILYEITVGRRLWRGSKEDSIRRIVEEQPVPPTFVLREYPSDLEMIVMRTLEKRPEDRYQTAREFADDLQLFLQTSGALMRSHNQMARYLRDLFSPASEAQITEDGLRRARIFAEGDEDGQQGDEAPLDFDQPASGPGAALARALRSAGPAIGTAAAPSSPAPDEVSDQVPHLSVPDEVPGVSVPAAANQEPGADGSGASLAPPEKEAPAQEVAPQAASVPSARQTPIVLRSVSKKKAAQARDKVPRNLPLGAILFVSVLLAAATAGVVWLLRGG